MERPVPPLGDDSLIAHQCEQLYRHLPDLDPMQPQDDPNAERAVHYIG
jgi:hypothetical protein